MALIHCYECGKEVSDQAAFCPGCGYPNPAQLTEEVDDTSDDTDVVSEDLVAFAKKLLDQETNDEVREVKLQILKRIAAESDIKPARIPAPMNITEIGGYFNLMMKLKQNDEMLTQTLTSILGLPVQTPISSINSH